MANMKILHQHFDSLFSIALDDLANTASYQILPSDNGKMLTNGGATGPITLTLPAIGVGYVFLFAVTADQNMIIASKEGANIIAPNTLVANSIAFQTAGDRIGGMLRIFSGSTGTKWHIQRWSAAALTIT